MYIPRPVVLNVILLNLLNVVVCLRKVHSLGILPSNIARQTQTCQHKNLEPKDWAAVQLGDDAKVLG